MGYMSSWNANKIIDLDHNEVPSEEQIDELQLTESELVELDAE